MWYQLTNGRYSQLIWDRTKENAKTRFHNNLEGTANVYNPHNTEIQEILHKKGITSLNEGSDNSADKQTAV